jgi:anti-sigma-K factor RskA
MERDGIHELTAAYALDALDPADEREYEDHLARCASCQTELSGFREVAAHLAYVPEGPSPPAALRVKILERARQEPAGGNVVPLRSRRAFVWTSAVAAVAAVVALGIGIWAASLSRDLDRERDTVRVLADPARSLDLAGASGQVAIGDHGEAVLAVSELPAAPAGKTYEIWVIEGKTPRRAGLFEGDDPQDVVPLTRRVPEGAVVAVTVERDGGVDAPTSKPIFATSA